MKFESHLEHIVARVLRFAVGQNDYGVLTKKSWWKVYSLTLPLNLTKCLLKLKEHWNIIAPHQLLKSPQNQLDFLIGFFKELQQMSPEISLSWNELYNFFKYCAEFVNTLPYEYYHITDVFLNDLMTARKILREKINSNIRPDDELSIILSNNLNVSNNNNSCNVENILLNILNEVDTFCLKFYNANGYERNLSKNTMMNTIHSSKSLPYDKQIENYCCKLSNIIKVMSKIKVMTSEQILESRITINEFLKAIVGLNEDLVRLNTENLINYVLMKDKNLFLNILVFFQNNLAAMKNLVTSIKF